jgi:hypothetical protein
VEKSNEISDDEWLLRRIPPHHSPVEYQDPALGEVRQRPPSAAFALGIGELGLSFHLESSLRAAGEQLTYGCPEGVPGWSIARIQACRLRDLGLTLVRDEVPHHVQAFGLADLGNSRRKKIQQEIAKASDYVVGPRAS